MLRKISTADLPLGEDLEQTLYSDANLLLLRKGRLFTESHRRTLLEQGYEAVYIHDDEKPDGGATAAEQTEAARPHDEPPSATSPSLFRTSSSSGQSERCLPYRPDTALRIERLVESTAEMVTQLATLLIDEQLRDAQPFQKASQSLYQEIRSDQDQTLHQLLSEEEDRDLARRCTQLSVLSMSVAKQMGLSDQDVMQVGTAGLLCDIALFGLPPQQRAPSRQMRSNSRKVFENHPALADRLLATVDSVDMTVRQLVLQSHEQLDGSGFPHGLTDPQIHRLARAINLADAYLTMVDPGLGRRGIIPADAMAYLVHHSCAGRFDRSVMKALLQVLSLYPVGSMVQLSDNSSARVLRAQGEDVHCPVVLRQGGEHAIIDLAESALTIMQPLSDATHSQHRLLAKKIDEIMWGVYLL